MPGAILKHITTSGAPVHHVSFASHSHISETIFRCLRGDIDTIRNKESVKILRELKQKEFKLILKYLNMFNRCFGLYFPAMQRKASPVLPYLLYFTSFASFTTYTLHLQSGWVSQFFRLFFKVLLQKGV